MENNKSFLPDRVIRAKLPERVVKKIGTDQLQRLEQNLEFDKGQLATLQIICKDKDKCPYSSECPIETPPVGSKCPVEIYYQERWLANYYESYGIEPVNRQYDQLLVSLVSVDIQLMRAQQIIQKEGFEEIVVTETQEGKKRIEKKLHSLLQYINQLEDRKLKLIKELKEFIQKDTTTQLFGDLAKILSQNK